MARKDALSSAETLLENDPMNPCIGCGPRNERGLRLAFHREGAGVRAELATDASMQGWPGRLHTGVLYTALVEAANWTVYAVRGRVGLPVRTSALETSRWIETGSRITLLGRPAPVPEGTEFAVEAEARLPDGTLVARLTRAYVFPSRAVFMQRMGYDALPPELEELLPLE